MEGEKTWSVSKVRISNSVSKRYVFTSLSVTEVLGLGSSFAVVWLLPDGVLLASANDVPIFFSNTCFKENPIGNGIINKL